MNELKVAPYTLNGMIDMAFDIGLQGVGDTYVLEIGFTNASWSDPEVITFEEAGFGALADGVTQLTAATGFSVGAGLTVNKLRVRFVPFEDFSTTYITEDLAEEYFGAIGAYTINNIVITVTVS